MAPRAFGDNGRAVDQAAVPFRRLLFAVNARSPWAPASLSDAVILYVQPRFHRRCCESVVGSGRVVDVKDPMAALGTANMRRLAHPDPLVLALCLFSFRKLPASGAGPLGGEMRRAVRTSHDTAVVCGMPRALGHWCRRG